MFIHHQYQNTNAGRLTLRAGMRLLRGFAFAQAIPSTKGLPVLSDETEAVGQGSRGSLGGGGSVGMRCRQESCPSPCHSPGELGAAGLLCRRELSSVRQGQAWGAADTAVICKAEAVETVSLSCWPQTQVSVTDCTK